MCPLVIVVPSWGTAILFRVLDAFLAYGIDHKASLFHKCWEFQMESQAPIDMNLKGARQRLDERCARVATKNLPGPIEPSVLQCCQERLPMASPQVFPQNRFGQCLDAHRRKHLPAQSILWLVRIAIPDFVVMWMICVGQNLKVFSEGRELRRILYFVEGSLGDSKMSKLGVWHDRWH